ncbi:MULTISPECIES: EAL domain-containing protein [unclassified Synechocystis]|uniref:EAL domain-containing protein n=1 Tax=unclassified Synechocystis TaxID=2640012 RepID=UPI000404F56A|nr:MULTISPECIES: EAL domain-containing protein [unclassified Synechocystis]AIE74558.1 hypothetical protein D082_20300 [Synechocystis sp. PCC 6714]
MSNDSIVRHVLVIEDQKSRRIVSLEENTYDIGRDPSSAIPIYDRQVSRHHATLIRVNDYQNHQYTYRLIDGNLQGKRSTNGVVVNGQYCLSHELEHGDVIRFGNKSKASYHIMNLTTESEEHPYGVEPAPVAANPGGGETYVDPLNFAIAEQDYGEGSGFDHEAVEVGEDPAFSTAVVYNDELADVGRSSTVQSNNPLGTLSENSTQLIVELTIAGRVLYANGAAKALFPDLMVIQVQHPLIQGLTNLSLAREGLQMERDIAIGNKIFHQRVFLSPDRSRLLCYSDDVTEHRKMEQQFNELRYRLRAYREHTATGFLLVDARTKTVVEANSAFCQLLGYEESEIVDLTLYQLMAAERPLIEELLINLETQDYLPVPELEYRNREGQTVQVKGDVYRQSWDGKDLYCFVMRTPRGRQGYSETLANQALYDPITKLPNRINLQKELSLAIDAAAHHQHLMGVMFIHLEILNRINQAHGFSFGDEVFMAFHGAIADCMRSGDTIGQWDSGTLVIILAKIKSPQDSIRLAERIIDRLKNPLTVHEREIIFNINIGISAYPNDGNRAEDLLSRANTALQKVRQTGFNHYQFYDAKFSTAALYQARLENLLQQAIAKRQLTLHYQPQIHLQSEQVTTIEALLRWEHPEVGDIAPDKIIPIAAQSNLIFELSNWILQTACQQNLDWQKDGLPLRPMAINLSAPEFYRPDLVMMVAKTLNETGLDPQWLELEITESTLRQQPAKALAIIQDLKSFGVKIALDDFGRGQISIGFITQFPLTTIKIHQSLISQLRGTPQEMAILQSILVVSQGFQYRLVAEGVETEAQLSLVRQLQCQEVQGFLFSRPLRKREIGQLLQKQLHQS